MCGITGFLNRNGAPADAAIVRRMTAALVHRGPDDVGEWVEDAVALGHRRLSIIDVSRGHQPMELVDDPDLHIVYNGEVYNHAALRGELDRSPGAYRSHCDTETVLAAYHERGSTSLHSLRGMFAFAVHDRREQALFLARDRLGIKPLYYFESPTLFAFASEIKALLAHPAIEARVNEARLPVQLALKYTLDDETLFEGIRKLLPGHWLRVGRSGIELERYWDLRFEPKTRFGSLDEAAEEFGRLFRESVELRLMSDVPLGVFLSGGIDSSAIAAAMADATDEPIRSFSVGFREPGYDERTHARSVAAHIGSDHREVLLTPEDWFRAWPRMLYHEDGPIAHPSSISLHFVSKLAAKDVKVVLTGEGADELLAGYERYYQTLANLRVGRFVPPPLRRLAAAAIDRLPPRWGPVRKAKRTALCLENDLDTLFLDNYAAVSRAELRSLLRPGRSARVDDCYAPFARLLESSDAEALLDKLEKVVIPTYYNDRGRFIDIMRHAIALNGSFFNTQRMMQQYVLRAYFS